MKKHIIIATLMISNTAWSMNYKDRTKTAHTNELETLVPSLQKSVVYKQDECDSANKKEGLTALDTIITSSGIHIPEPSKVEGSINSSDLFVMHPQRSKL
jgi:hypothetical protein